MPIPLTGVAQYAASPTTATRPVDHDGNRTWAILSRYRLDGSSARASRMRGAALPTSANTSCSAPDLGFAVLVVQTRWRQNEVEACPGRADVVGPKLDRAPAGGGVPPPPLIVVGGSRDGAVRGVETEVAIVRFGAEDVVARRRPDALGHDQQIEAAGAGPGEGDVDSGLVLRDRLDARRRTRTPRRRLRRRAGATVRSRRISSSAVGPSPVAESPTGNSPSDRPLSSTKRRPTSPVPAPRTAILEAHPLQHLAADPAHVDVLAAVAQCRSAFDERRREAVSLQPVGNARLLRCQLR